MLSYQVCAAIATSAVGAVVSYGGGIFLLALHLHYYTSYAPPLCLWLRYF